MENGALVVTIYHSRDANCNNYIYGLKMLLINYLDANSCWADGSWECLSLWLVDTTIGDFLKRRDQMTMGYFDNFDNGSIKKYKKKS
jgi:hypothetical protein